MNTYLVVEGLVLGEETKLQRGKLFLELRIQLCVFQLNGEAKMQNKSDGVNTHA